jgi:uncharacterized protein (TIGR02757 family)
MKKLRAVSCELSAGRRKKKLIAISYQLSAKEKETKRKLDALVVRYGADYLSTDPLEFPRRYQDRADTEAAALICALFAYGNVTSMKAFLEGLLAALGPSPAGALKEGRGVRARPYRFQAADDVKRFLGGLGRVLKKHGSVEAAFCRIEGNPEARLENLAVALRRASGRLTPGLAHLLPLPSSGSACKRWRLFLRWVIREEDGVDLGLWSCLKPAELIIPVDVHVARMSRRLGLTQRRSPDRIFALEVTESLRRLCPEDPVKYDFALARPGILKRTSA